MTTWQLPEGSELRSVDGVLERWVDGEMVPVYGCMTVEQHELFKGMAAFRESFMVSHRKVYPLDWN